MHPLLLRKFRSALWKKKWFGEERKRKIKSVLLSKTKSLFKNIKSILGNKEKKLIFGLYVKKKKKSDLFCNKKFRFAESFKKSDLFFMWKKKIFFIRGLHSWNKSMLLASNKTKHHYSWPSLLFQNLLCLKNSDLYLKKI